MHDLRKKALLESGKKTSRKSGSRVGSNRGSAVPSPNISPGHSQPGSRANSRPGSRYASEDEDFSDTDAEDRMTSSTGSVPELEPIGSRMQGLISSIQDRKGSSHDSRTALLARYVSVVRLNPSAEESIRKSLSDILPPLLKSMKKDGSPEEQVQALKALALTALTAPDDIIYELAFTGLKAICEDSDNEDVKVEALFTMCIVVTYGGGAEQEMQEFLEFLTDITDSDGQLISAADSAAAVTAAMQAWGFVASHVDSLRDQSQPALAAFVEQLESSDADVQTAAGANIALLFEIAHKLEEDEDADESLNLQVDRKHLIKRMTELARGSKSISRKNRRNVRRNFNSVITSLELNKGPGWSTAGRPSANPHLGGSVADTQDEDVQAFGYREKIKADGRVFVIKSWSSLICLDMMKHVLESGFTAHFVGNEIVSDTLGDLEPDSEDHGDEFLPSAQGTDSPRRKAKGSRSVSALWDT